MQILTQEGEQQVPFIHEAAKEELHGSLLRQSPCRLCPRTLWMPEVEWGPKGIQQAPGGYAQLHRCNSPSPCHVAW